MFEKIEQLLAEHKISLNKLSKQTGIPYTTLQNWRARGSSPRLENVKKIAEFFQVPLEYFSDDKKDFNSNISLSIGSINNSEVNAFSTIINASKEEKDIYNQKIFDITNELNKEGQKRLLEQAELLLGKYKK